MEIFFLGTSGYGITKTRNLPSTLINKEILVDCGEGTLKTLVNNNIDLENIQAIFITHFHPDHIIGLISILFQMAFFSGKTIVPPSIYVPEGMKSSLLNLFDATYSPFKHIDFNLNITELLESYNSPIKIKDKNNKIKYLVDWITLNHYPICYAYNFNKILTICGDTKPCEKIKKISMNTKLLIHEASFDDKQSETAHKYNHSTPIDAAKIAKKCNVEYLILYHLPDLLDNEEESFLRNAKTHFKNIELAYDCKVVYI